MTASTLRPQLRSALLRQVHQSKAGKKGLLAKGFTLVELMIVIVIVGILSAIALPNFLSQSNKAKAAEAKTISSAYLKQIYAAYQEGGTSSTDGTGSIPCPNPTKYFTYTCAATSSSNQVTATGNADSGDLSGKTVTSSVALTGTTSGTVTVGNPS